MTDILIVEPNDLVREGLVAPFKSEGLDLISATDIFQAQSMINANPPSMIVFDLAEDNSEGMDQLKQLRRTFPDINVIVTSAFCTANSVVDAMKLGVCDFISKPFSPQDLIQSVKNSMDTSDEEASLKDDGVIKDLIGKSQAIINIQQLIKRMKDSAKPVFIFGESGVGKTRIASIIHEMSDRASKPMLSINCSAFSNEAFLEGELFGFVKGAFPGANLSREGLLVKGNGGTVVLEEIGDLPLGVQAKLLRFLQSNELSRVGENMGISTNTRIITTSRSDLKGKIDQDLFRGDLFFRLNSISIEIPPLRKRREDIPLLIKYFLKNLHKRGGLHHKIDKKAQSELCSLPYKGNVRELKNIMDQILTATNKETIDLMALDKARIQKTPQEDTALQKVSNTEKEIIEEVVKRNPRDMDSAAQELGISRTTLWRRMKKYNLLSSKKEKGAS